MSHEYPYSIKRHGTTLEKCEDEPVQTPGCIQAHGVLLVLRCNDLTILQASENSEAWLGLPPQELLAKNVARAVGESVAQEIRAALDHERLDKVPLYLTTLKAGAQKNSRSLHVSLHTHLGLALLELEEAVDSDREPANPMRFEPDYYGLVRKTLTRFQEASSIKAIAHAITEEVRRITELDRVMVYYFHADDSGEVIAESKREGQPSWLGWRYPAHDIPRPAREIFKKIWSRPVPDVRAKLFEMMPLLNPDTQKALDMTYCSLRGASIMYTEYLDNMGVRAALTLPLIHDGELWGLIACHHDTPKLLSYRVRAAAEFLARGASQQIRLAEERENTDYRLALEAANYALISKVALAPELSAFTEGPVHLGSGLDCGGAAILCQETWNKVGQTPQIQEMAALGQWLLTRPEFEETSLHPIFVTDHLSELYPAAKDFAGSGSGLMAFRFSRNPLGMVLYFKPETIQTMTWGGDPHALPIVEGPHGKRLSPRKSFELWCETVSNRAMPWKKVEIEAMLKLRSLIIGMLVSKAEQLNALRLLVAERTRELEKSRDRLDAILNSSLDGIVAFEAVRDQAGALLDLSFVLVNPASEKLMRESESNLLGQHLREKFPVVTTDGLYEKYAQIVDRGVALDFEYCSLRSEVPRWFRIAGVKLGDGLVLSYAEITARKQAEETLRASEERFRLTVESVKDYAIFMLDPRGNVTTWNSGAERIKGYAANEIIGRHFSCFYLPEAVATGHPHTELRRAAAEGRYAEEGWRVRKDGSRFLAEVVITAILDDSGKLRGFSKVTRDISERRNAEDQFKTYARRLSLATEVLQAGIWDWDVQTNDIVWDKKMHEIYGTSPNVPVDYKLWAQAVVPDDLPRAEATLQNVIASKSQGSAEFRITHADGSIRHIQAAEGAILDDFGRVTRVVGVNMDVTERKKLELHFLRAQRMESIGTLAGGIAHDLNNILAPIVMSIDLLKVMADDPEAKSILETIDSSARRGADIVRQVLSFARGMEGDRIEVQPNHLVKELENIIKDTFPKDIRLQFSIPKGTWTILGDPTQVHQVLMNLCLNARDAMPHGGLLTLRVENCTLDEQYAAMNLHAKAGKYVNICVTDTGTGIPREILDKIFEPFFTTKVLTKGTGLGLSSVMAIVKSHEGIINVDSELGKGSTFKLYLPALESSSKASTESFRTASLPRGNGETILVVDDEAPIRTITAQTLQAYGYRVLTAPDGADAVAIYFQHRDEIAVVLTDMNMPVMDGRATIHALMKINPVIKIIAASGLGANGSVTKTNESTVKHFLTKPYSAETLLKSMRAILNEV